MSKASSPSNTQKMIMLSLYEGWMLRYIDTHGWCLLQPGRERPFASVKARTVRKMTEGGWLTPGQTTKGLGYRPAKDLTPLGHKLAEKLVRDRWAETYEFDPYDQTVRSDVFQPTSRLAA